MKETSPSFLDIYRIKYLQRIINYHLESICNHDNLYRTNNKWIKSTLLPIDNRLISIYAMPFDFIQPHIRLMEKCNLDIEKYCYHPNATLSTLKQLLKWHKTFKIEDTELIDKIAAVGHVDIISFLMNKYRSETKCKHAVDLAAERGYVDVVKYLYSKYRRNGGCSTNAIDLASGNGHVECVKYLIHRKEKFTRWAMNKAAEKGHLEIVEILHNADGKCTKDAMDKACMNGHLPVVKFLHTHRSEGGSRSSMDLAAGGGHLAVVEYLHNNNIHNDKWSTFAMDLAATSGHLEVVEFLDKNRKEGGSTDAMDRAAGAGHLKVVQYLHQHRSEGCTGNALILSAAYGHLSTVEFLLNNRTFQHDDITQARQKVYQGEDRDKIISILNSHLPSSSSSSSTQSQP